MSNDPPKPMTDQDVVALARDAIEASREDNLRRAAVEAPGAAKDLQQQPGITIDLGHKNIVNLPDEVIDVIRAEIERLALSHNNLSNLPSRLPECRRLRYLNVRYNALREMPSAILQMTSLEILDVSKNKIKILPESISNLTSLKVLAIQKNKIERLPVGLGDIASLQVLKLDGNPLVFPPDNVCTINDSVPSPSNDNEKDAVIATQVKKFMRLYASDISSKEKRRVESEGSESESNLETPRPSKRAISGRFPVKPSISTFDIFADTKPEPSPGGPPPIPTRSHFREQSQQNNSLSRRPPVPPLVISNGNNERNRSQSEGAGSATIRAKRMGIYTHKTSDLGPVDELRRNSHFRGFSQGYVLSSNGRDNGNSGPATAGGYGDTGTQRPLIHRPLSDLLEHKRRSRAPDVVVEAAKSFLYAMSQLHDTMLSLMRAIKKDRSRGGYRKEELPRRFTIAFLQLKKLSELLRRFDTLAEEDEEDAHKISASIHQTCQKSLAQFLLVNVLIAENAHAVGNDGDPRFMRSFLFLQTGSMIELRKACEVLGVNFKGTPTAGRKLQSSNRLLPPAREPRPLVVRRFQTTPPHQRTAQAYPMPPPVPLHSNESSRTNTLTSISAATPRSGESFLTTTTMSRTNTMQSSFDDPDEESQFERIYFKLKTACDQCEKNVPRILSYFRKTYESERPRLDSEDPKMKILLNFIDKAESVLGAARTLNERLSEIKLKDAVARSQHDFWQQCTLLTKAWNEMAGNFANEAKKLGLNTDDFKVLMKPVHHAVKAAGLVINISSWSYLATSVPNAGAQMGPPSLQSLTSKTQPPKFYNQSNLSNGPAPGFPGPINTSITPATSGYSAASTYSATSFTSQSSAAGGGSMGYVTPVPATPLSAALGAAAQATVPNTPNQPPGQGGSVNTGPFAGNVFERADRLLQQQRRAREAFS